MVFIQKNKASSAPIGNSPKRTASTGKVYPATEALISMIDGTSAPGGAVLIDITLRGANMADLVNGPSIGKDRASVMYSFSGCDNTFVGALNTNAWVHLSRCTRGADGTWTEFPKQDRFIKFFSPAATAERLAAMATALDSLVASLKAVHIADLAAGEDGNHLDWTATGRQNFINTVTPSSIPCIGAVVAGPDIVALLKDNADMRAAFSVSAETMAALTDKKKPGAKEESVIKDLSKRLFGDDKTCLRSLMNVVPGAKPTVSEVKLGTL